MKAPGDAPAVVSPLTTLVQNHAETFSKTTAEAVTAIAQTTGLSENQIKGDYTKGSSSDTNSAFAFAQAVVVAVQQQNNNAKATIGTDALDGKKSRRPTWTKRYLNRLATSCPLW